MYRATLGKLVVITGPDGVGKSTQCRILSQIISPIEVFSFPAIDTTPGMVLKYVLQHGIVQDPYLIQRLNALSRLKKREEMLEALTRSLVLCDRYSSDGLVYGLAGGCDRNWLDKLRSTDLQEDLTICLLGKGRRNGGDLYDRDDKLQARVAELYHSLAETEGWIVINADESINRVTESIVRCLIERGIIHNAS
jgi:thymidylate kinase